MKQFIVRNGHNDDALEFFLEGDEDGINLWVETGGFEHCVLSIDRTEGWLHLHGEIPDDIGLMVAGGRIQKVG